MDIVTRDKSQLLLANQYIEIVFHMVGKHLVSNLYITLQKAIGLNSLSKVALSFFRDEHKLLTNNALETFEELNIKHIQSQTLAKCQSNFIKGEGFTEKKNTKLGK